LVEGIVVSKCDLDRVGRIVVSKRDSSRLEGIVALRHDLSGLREEIVAFRRDLSGLEGIVASKRNSTRVRGSIEGFRRVHAIARFLRGTLGSNCYKAFCFVSLLALEVQQEVQVANNLLVDLFFAKEETKRF
jgi:hypothetical protein